MSLVPTLILALASFTKATGVTLVEAIIMPDVLVAQNASIEQITGKVTVTQTDNEVAVISINLANMVPNKIHGIHIHAAPVASNHSCDTAMGHFNPSQVLHGDLGAAVRHAGDLGNIQADANGNAVVKLSNDLISVQSGLINDISGLGFVIHEKADDLGVGNMDQSITYTGNAGKRYACGNLVGPGSVPSQTTETVTATVYATGYGYTTTGQVVPPIETTYVYGNGYTTTGQVVPPIETSTKGYEYSPYPTPPIEAPPILSSALTLKSVSSFLVGLLAAVLVL